MKSSIHGPRGRSSVLLLALAAANAGCNMVFGLEQGVPPIGDAEVDDSGADVATNDTAITLDSAGGDTEDSASDTLADSGAPPSDGPCSPLADLATNIYVDGASLKSSTGTLECPFHTILEATTLPVAIKRIIHVAGGKPVLTYKETDAVHVQANVVLLGDGPSSTAINAVAGKCASVNCAVQVDAGGKIDGFAIVSNPLGPVSSLIVTAAGSPNPVVRNVTASESPGIGITVLGGADLGPNLRVNKNATSGVSATGGGGGASSTVHVISDATTPNSFDGNGQSGIDVTGTARLSFDGGSASSNIVHGIRFGAGLVFTGGPAHSVTGLVARANGQSGIFSGMGSSLVLRNSTLAENRIGLSFDYGFGGGGGSTLDIGGGSPSSVGANVFGGLSKTSNNTYAGIFLCRSGPYGSQAAASDSFRVCPPVQTIVSGCDAVAGGLATDVAYFPRGGAGGKDPVNATPCLLGP